MEEQIKEERQGFGKPNLIYIGKIEHDEIQIEHIKTEDYELEYLRHIQ